MAEKSDNKYLDYEGLKIYDGKLKEWAKELDEPIDAAFVTNNSVGALPSGTSIKETDTLASLIMKMLVSVKDATLKSNPTMTALSNTGGTAAGSYEVGTTINTNLGTEFKDGVFNSYKAGSNTQTELLDAGCVATGPTYTLKAANDASVDYTAQSSFVLKEGTTTITGSFVYAASSAKAKKSDGSESALNIKAGTVSQKLTWTGQYHYFLGQFTTANYPGDDAIARGIFTSHNAGLPAPVDFRCNVVLLAVKKGSKEIVAMSSANEEQSYTKLSVKIADAAGELIDYEVYKYSYAAEGGLDAKVTFSYK